MPCARRDTVRRHSSECGAAVVEFTLVSVVLVALFLAIVQVGLVLHVRNMSSTATYATDEFR